MPDSTSQQGALRRIAQLWDRLTLPVESITDPVRRQKARLMASLLLAMGLFILLLLPLRYLSIVDSPDYVMRLAVALLSGMWVLFNYTLARRGFYELAGIMVSILGTIAILVTSAAAETTGVSTLYYLIILTLFCGLFFSSRSTLWVFSFHVIGMFILVLVADHVDVQALIQGPLVYNILMTVIILIFALYREQLEAVRQQDVSRSEERYRALFVRARDAILIEDGAGTILDANPAASRLFGYDHDQLIGMNIRDLHKLDGDNHTSHNWVISNGVDAPVERIAIHKDGRLIPVEMTHASLRTNNRTLYLSVIRDATIRTRAEQQRLDLAIERERVALLETIISDLNHDLMTPISIIKTGVYLLRRTTTAERRAERLDQIDEQLKRLQSMVEDVLTLSRLDRDAASAFNFSWGDLNKSIARVVNDYQDFARHRERHFEFEPDISLPPWSFDDSRLRLAVANLVKNALTYTKSGDRVTVRTGQNHDDELHYVYIEVEDTGPGIPADHLPYILNRFYRAEKHRPTGVGAGLGLSIVQKIVEAHGGTIEVRSELEQGSTFRILLPFMRQNKPQPI